ncbi:hypothetical protein KUTeg_024203 [Tegillarca granosa]|uniref:Uncharacterized protein n=1 Tax=Tegillarca granosa TaxID=220873 RepID=A0ABQ9E278_TEGGR|nr:hypothetical protein KUTeg_024203 [Tegillarca granosa]
MDLLPQKHSGIGLEERLVLVVTTKLKTRLLENGIRPVRPKQTEENVVSMTALKNAIPVVNVDLPETMPMYNCERFTNPRFYNNFNSQGRQWVNNTGRCLTKKMKTLYERPRLSCRETKTYMLGVISDCYVQSGFCDIMIGNARALVDVYEVDNFLQSIGVFREVFQIASHCAEGVAQRFVQEMTRLLGDQFTFHG